MLNKKTSINIPQVRLNIFKKKKIKRDAILEFARITFKTFGFHKTTMNKIAKTAKMGKSSIYHYFESKEEIYKFVVFNEARKYRKTVLKALRQVDTPYEKIKSYIMIRLQTDEVLFNFHNALRDPKLRYISFIDRLKKIYDKEEFRIFRTILHDGVSSGYFKILDIEHAAVGIVTAMRGIESTLLLTPDDPQLEAKIENVLNIVLYGIVKR